MNRKEFAEWLLRMIQEFPNNWTWDEYHVTFKNPEAKHNLTIWIANRPYADLTINRNSGRIGTWWQRRKIRKALDDLHRKRSANYFTPKSSKQIEEQG